MLISLHEQVRLLSTVDVFDGLSPEDIEELSRRARDTFLDRGEAFIMPQEGQRLFVLKKGHAQVYEMDRNGQEITLSVVEEGNIFGEVALTGQQPPGVYVRALEPCVVCSLRCADIERIVLSHPEVGLKLVRRLSERLRETEIRLAELASKGVLARLAGHILRIAEREGVVTNRGIMVPTHYTHERLGTMIAAKRVAVTRAFNELRQTGAVEVNGRRIHIRDSGALRRIADAEASPEIFSSLPPR
jgi:CRP/FNR family transcriptional regulator, cyclic AMP receptor protein